MGETLQLERQKATAALAMGVLALILIVAGLFVAAPHLFIGAAAPVVLAFWLWLRQPMETRVTFGPEAMIEEQRCTIRYQDIVGITVAGQACAADGESGKAGEVVITEWNAKHRFKDLTRSAARALHKQLTDRIPASGSRQVTTELQQRLHNELAMFDDDLVQTYCMFKVRGAPQSHVSGFALSLGAIALIWLICGSLGTLLEGWFFVGLFLAFISLALLLILYFWSIIQKDLPNSVSKASIIISPRGLALHQGDLKGVITWGEIKRIDCGTGTNFAILDSNLNRSILVRVAGSVIHILDIYDRPLGTIHRSMKHYWDQR